MSPVFISHAEEDAEVALEITNGLEAASYGTWYNERDTVAGGRYLSHTAQVIKRCQTVLLAVSPDSRGSNQVTKEVINSFEKGKPFLPVVHGITRVQIRHPESTCLWGKHLRRV